MKGWNLRIELRSDFCTATGENAPGIINSKTALEYGIPRIPAKRIKGCLLEAGRELADNGMIEKTLLSRIFGCPGRERGEGIRVGDGRLSFAPEYLFGQGREGGFEVGDFEEFLKDVKACSDIDEVILEEIFTRKRTRTALEKSGTAKEHSLRTVQVVPSGIVFCSRIEGDLNQEEEDALRRCAKGLRYMGTDITRGMGEVRCTLEEAQREEAAVPHENIDLLKRFSSEEEISLSYEIMLKMPVILEGDSGEGADQIPGSVIAGALAGMYIKKHSLGKDAHEEDGFQRIFLRDGVQFGNAFLRQNGKTYAPCPKAFAVLKDDKEEWLNTMEDEKNRRRKNISGQVCLADGCLYKADPRKEIHFHHARPADRGIGHALNDRAEDTSLPTGQFFEYTALSADQVFAGTWRGTAKDIKSLVECLEDGQYRLMLGRSRTAEYGSCEFRITDISAAGRQEKDSARGRDWLVWLLSPLVFMNRENGMYETDSTPLKKQIEETLKCTVDLKDEICDCTVVSGYNSRWRLPAVPVPALAAGSAFHISTDKEVEAWEIERKRWGMMTGKGCGQVKAVLWKDCHGGKVAEESGAAPDNARNEDLSSPDGKELFAEILRYQNQRLEREKEAEEVLKCLNDLGEKIPSSSDIDLLLQMLRGRNETPGSYEQLEGEASRIRREGKQQQILDFIKPCAGRSPEFIRQYLEAAKWKERRNKNYGRDRKEQ